MARTAAPKIVEWGTPPEPEPTGWDAIQIELRKRPGRWANVGTFAKSGANRVQNDKVPASDGFETRLVPVKDDPTRIVVWVRFNRPEDSTEVETRSADVEDTDTTEDTERPTKPRTVKRGSVV